MRVSINFGTASHQLIGDLNLLCSFLFFFAALVIDSSPAAPAPMYVAKQHHLAVLVLLALEGHVLLALPCLSKWK